MNVALQPTGAIVDTCWQQAFYAYLDAFLTMARSVPEIISACFGKDFSPAMKDWFNGLPTPETDRRKTFSSQFKTTYNSFKELSLSNARNISLHRTGVAPVEVNITGRFGVSHVGTPVRRVATSESRPIAADDDPALQWATALAPISLQPTWTDFSIDGRPLFPECRAYLDEARKLLTQARGISQQVHGNDSLTLPP